MFEWIFILGIFVSFYNAWGGGANDCANSFATSVGSGVLTLKSALLIASIFEFSGAVLMGSHVTDMVRKQIVSVDLFEDNPGVLMLGMLCANLSSAIWLTIATYFKWPVSTTHSIIGSIIGFSLAYGGSDGISWEDTGMVVASWVISPLLAGTFALTFFTIIDKVIFSSANPVDKIIRFIPILIFLTFLINTIFIIYKGSPQLDLDETPFWVSLLASIGISAFIAILAQFLYVPFIKRKMENTNIADRTISYNEAIQNGSIEMGNLNTEDSETDNSSNTDNQIISTSENNSIDENISLLKNGIKHLETVKDEQIISELHKNAKELDSEADQLCSWVQIVTACFSSFAHGSNDVANAVAPLATIYYIYKKNDISQSTDVPIWVLLIGGLGIVFGLATWGYKIINRMGKGITKISPSRGFIIELASALTVIMASRLEFPVSTTHCQVGSIVGCGLTSGFKNIEWKLLKNILISWFITLPVTGFLSAGIFSFAYFSPNKLNELEYFNGTEAFNYTEL